MNKKRCTKCGEFKSLKGFYKKSDSATGTTSACKTCTDIKNRAWAKNNSAHDTHRAKYRRAYRLKNKDKIKKTVNAWRKTFRGFFLSKAKALRLNIRKLECTIDAQYLILLYNRQGGRCALTGRVMVLHSGNSCGLNNLSVDRKNRKRGYVKGNLRLVTHQVNSARSAGTDAQLKSMCRDVLRTPK